MPIAFLRSPRKMRAHGRCRSRGRTERAHRSLENRPERGFPQRPPASSLQEEERTERKPSTSSTHEIPDSPDPNGPPNLEPRTSDPEPRTSNRYVTVPPGVNMNTHAIDETRRKFLAHFSALGLGGTLLPGVLWAEMQQSGAQQVTPDMLKGALALSGLNFSDDDQKAMLRGVNQNLTRYAD